MEIDCKRLVVPVVDLSGLCMGDRIVVSGCVLCGRDAVLPKVCDMFAEGRLSEVDADFDGAAVFHTAVSQAGIGPTSSNKLEIEESFVPLCEAGVKVFLGKGALKQETVAAMAAHGAIYAVVPPVTALLERCIEKMRCVAFSELGMEALYEIKTGGIPAVIAAAGGMSMFGDAE